VGAGYGGLTQPWPMRVGRGRPQAYTEAVNVRTARNIAIILVIAAIVVVVPGGGTAARLITQAVSLAFLAAIAWFAMLMYREHRYDLYALGDRRRAILYVALGVAALTLTGTHKMWASSGGSVAWLVLLGGSVYAVVAVVVAARR